MYIAYNQPGDGSIWLHQSNIS